MFGFCSKSLEENLRLFVMVTRSYYYLVFVCLFFNNLGMQVDDESIMKPNLVVPFTAELTKILRVYQQNKLTFKF